MASELPLYALPLPTYSHRSTQAEKNRKRKHPREDEELSNTSSNNVEHTAILTPDERVQRRLAGQPIDRPPPPFPFPQAPPADAARKSRQHNAKISAQVEGPRSLRLQHLAAMTAVLHKCLAARDYNRALRALALILRTEVHGKTVDLRDAGLWGTGAEVLYKLPSVSDTESDSRMITRQGFEKARLFYNRMALQHPWHRSWPDVTNVQDFKIAYFGLWIYVVNQESTRLHAFEEEKSGIDPDSNHNDNRELAAKEWELAEAQEIAREMDRLMTTIPFADDVELIRLRGMVALWNADLFEAVETLRMSVDDQATGLRNSWVEDAHINNDSDLLTSSAKATSARSLATKMFDKLSPAMHDVYLSG